MNTLGDELPWQMARVRDQLIPAYLECGPGGLFAVAGMRADLDAAAAALLVASREPGQVGLHARAELESLRKYSAIPDVRVAVAPPPPLTPEQADEMIAEFERAHAAGAFAAPVPAGYRFRDLGSRPAAAVGAAAAIDYLGSVTAEQAAALDDKPREPGIGARVRWENPSTASWIEGVLLDRKPPAECWLAAIRVERCSSGFIRDSIVTVGVDCGRTLLIGADASSYPVAKAPMPEQLPAIRARLDEIRREPHQRIMLDTDPPARPDGFAQSQVDAAKAVLLASVPRKAGK